MKPTSLPIATTLLSALFLTACGSGGGDSLVFPSNDTPAVSAVPPPGDQPPAVAAPPIAQDNFDFQIADRFTADQPENVVSAIERDIGGSVAPLNTVSNVLASTTVPVNYDFCNVANAFYSPAMREIFLCHELTVAAFNFFLEDGTSDEEIDNAFLFARKAMTHVMYHEMGHALDDLTDVNVGGNFESAADAVAVVLAIQTGQPLVAATGGAFTLGSGDSSLFDEHGSGVDRAGDIFCWAFGGSPGLAARFTELAENFNEAGRDCVGEYANQFDFVEGLIPELRNIPSVAAISARQSQAFLDELSELDKKMAAAMRGL